MADNTIYDKYKDFELEIKFLADRAGVVKVITKHETTEVAFQILDNGTIRLTHGYPEFVQKEIFNGIRKQQRDNDFYLYGV
jgi:hypothetical protein